MKRKLINTLIFLFAGLLLLNNNIIAQNKSEQIETITSQIEIQKAEIQQLRSLIYAETSQLKQKLDSYAPSFLVLFFLVLSVHCGHKILPVIHGPGFFLVYSLIY